MSLSPEEAAWLLRRRSGPLIEFEAGPDLLRVFVPGKLRSMARGGQGSWRRKHGYAKLWRTRARSCFEHAMFRAGWRVPAAAPKRVLFEATIPARMDNDNFVYALKPCRDGMIDAGVIDRDDWDAGHEFVYPKPRVDGRRTALLGVWVTVQVKGSLGRQCST